MVILRASHMKFFEVYAYLLSHLEIKIFTSLLYLMDSYKGKIYDGFVKTFIFEARKK